MIVEQANHRELEEDGLAASSRGYIEVVKG